MKRYKKSPLSYEKKIVSPTALVKKLSYVHQKRTSRLVFTNGCFDILHKGHVHYLQEARNLGTHLLVALDTDAGVSQLKGPSRPINTLKDRLAVVAALECVDYVTWFSRGNPLSLIKKVKPHILVKGGDWKIDQIIGSQDVLSRGGLVKSLRFIKNRSSSRIIHKLESLQS